MVGRAVIALAVVLPDELPVALLNGGALMGDLGLGEAMGREIGLHDLPERREIGRRLRKADEEISGDALAGDRLQSVGRPVETLRHLASEQEAPVEVVAPLVIGADEAHRRTFVDRANPAAAMPAGVVESPDLALEVAHHEDRIVADLHGEEGARFVELAVVPDEQPLPVPDHLHVEAEVVGVDVERLRQSEAFAPALEPSSHVVARVHDFVLDRGKCAEAILGARALCSTLPPGAVIRQERRSRRTTTIGSLAHPISSRGRAWTVPDRR